MLCATCQKPFERNSDDSFVVSHTSSGPEVRVRSLITIVPTLLLVKQNRLSIVIDKRFIQSSSFLIIRIHSFCLATRKKSRTSFPNSWIRSQGLKLWSASKKQVSTSIVDGMYCLHQSLTLPCRCILFDEVKIAHLHNGMSCRSQCSRMSFEASRISLCVPQALDLTMKVARKRCGSRYTIICSAKLCRCMTVGFDMLWAVYPAVRTTIH